MKSPKNKNVLVLVDTASGWGRNIIRGIAKFAQEQGNWTLSMEPRGQTKEIYIPRNWKGDGIIARIASEKSVHGLKKTGLPVINVSSLHIHNCPFSKVISNFTQVGEMGARHFLDCGFKSFAFCASQFSFKSMQEIRISYSSYLKAHGATCDYLVLPDSDFVTDEDQEVVLRWIKKLRKPVAIFAMSVKAPFAIIAACKSAGILVPEEVSILSTASVDDLILEVIEPSVSCVVTADQTIGYEAAKLLRKLMRNPSRKNKREVLYINPTHVEVRQSSDITQTDDLAIKKAIRYIRENAASGVQVPDVASHVGLSRKSLELRMKKAIRRTPAEEIRQVRLDMAVKMLTESRLPIPDVATLSGFGTTEHFIVFFKKFTGLTPLQYSKKFSTGRNYSSQNQ
jgi:LacI family transcriptional regulator